MLKIIVFISFICITTFGVAQNDWNRFIERIPILPDTIEINDTSNFPENLVSKNEVWNFFLTGITKLNPTKPGTLQFVLDTLTILKHETWGSKKNWNKLESIQLYCPIFVGNMCTIGRKKQENQNLILWKIVRTDHYARGVEYWISTHDSLGKITDYMKTTTCVTSSFDKGYSNNTSTLLYGNLLFTETNENFNYLDKNEQKTSHYKTIYQLNSIGLFEKLIPETGYLFSISGDFNGDKQTDTLNEQYISGITKKPTHKFYKNIENYEDLVDLTVKQEPISFATFSDARLDTLFICSHSQNFGLSYIKNEGDLNNDGTDEISYVVNYADWSNCNRCYIYTFKNNHWHELYSFPIWDWMLSDVPGTEKEYSLFGTENVISTTNTEKPTEEFNGLIRKVGKRTIEIQYMSDDASLESKKVKLKK